MFTKETLLQDIAGMNINPKGTLLIHSSLKAIGPVEGGSGDGFGRLERVHARWSFDFSHPHLAADRQEDPDL